MEKINVENKWQLCVCGALRCGNEYLLIQRNPHDEDMAGFWEMPSGKAEFGETAEESLVREVFEEIGINISGLTRKIVGISEYSSSKNNINKYSVQLNYLVEVPTKELPISLSEEHINYAWATRDSSLVDGFIGAIIDDAEITIPSQKTKILHVRKK